jgi:hypothetical protein
MGFPSIINWIPLRSLSISCPSFTIAISGTFRNKSVIHYTHYTF